MGVQYRRTIDTRQKCCARTLELFPHRHHLAWNPVPVPGTSTYPGTGTVLDSFTVCMYQVWLQ